MSKPRKVKNLFLEYEVGLKLYEWLDKYGQMLVDKKKTAIHELELEDSKGNTYFCKLSIKGIKGANRMTDREYKEYLNNKPTIKGIVEEMKTWWSNEGSDEIIQRSFEKILELLGETK